MKKTVALILASIMVFSLAACAAPSAPAEEPKAAAEAAVPAAEEAAPAAEEAAAEAETETQKFIMGIDPEYPPFSYLGDDGDYTGFDVEICKAACEKLGWEFEVFEVNWD